jgi:hypothetical protein
VLGVEQKQVGKGQRLIVTHTDLSTGKTDGKQLVEFYTDKEVWGTLAGAKPGDFFTIHREKNASGFWDWKGVSKSDGSSSEAATAPSVAAKATTQARSNYETPEERAARQVMIVRQSSISSAVAFLAPQGVTDPDAVITVAKKFEEYVLTNTPDQVE